MMDEKTVMDVIRWSHGKSSSPHIDDTNWTLAQTTNVDTNLSKATGLQKNWELSESKQQPK
jgi:hypothetical protein